MEVGPVPAQGYLRSRGVEPEVFIRFQYNPAKITDKQGISYVTTNTPGQLMPTRQYTGGGDRTFAFTVHIAGSLATNNTATNSMEIDADGSIERELQKYRALAQPKSPAWQQAGRSFAGIYSSTQVFNAPPVCRFGLGERVLDCLMVDMSIDETMFNPALKPLRATVKLTLAELSPYGAPLIPVSGGTNAS